MAFWYWLIYLQVMKILYCISYNFPPQMAKKDMDTVT